MPDARCANALLDTSVLINFLAVDRAALLGSHPDFHFAVTEHVRLEITAHYGDQLVRLETAFKDGLLQETRVEAIEELGHFAKLSQNPRLGLGECAAIAAAIGRGRALAIDDRAARKAATSLSPTHHILDTQAFMIALVRSGMLEVAEADNIKDAWELHHSFRLKIRSFGDAL